MPTYKTPGVFIEEVPLSSPSVAEVETAVPAFIGYTEKARKDGEDLTLKPTPIGSLVEFEQFFGGPSPVTPRVKSDDTNAVAEVNPEANTYFLYDSLRLFFDNGGAKCYIVSVGTYGTSPALGDDTSGILGGLTKLEQEDEPTILLAPDAALLAGGGLYQFQRQALVQCAKLQDRVLICDLHDTGDFDADQSSFRDNIGTENLKYGAAYTPWLKASYAKNASRTRNVVPPSGAVAGIYSRVDRTRGVWKAPANTSISSVIEPTVEIDAKAQEGLNVDLAAGKSINAIRAFPGKGTLVWGARTLAGNDNEWRYVSVRRFFNMVGESVKKSTDWAVFEANDANTWIRVQSMIENYLTQKWREGALQGAEPAHAYFVKVGLGETMTAEDIVEGRMIVEIGMAAVRPAEFIVLRFSHKMMGS